MKELITDVFAHEPGWFNIWWFRRIKNIIEDHKLWSETDFDPVNRCCWKTKSILQFNLYSDSRISWYCLEFKIKNMDTPIWFNIFLLQCIIRSFEKVQNEEGQVWLRVTELRHGWISAQELRHKFRKISLSSAQINFGTSH